MADSHPIRTRIVASLVVVAIVSLVVYLVPGGWRWLFDGVHAIFSWLGGSWSVARWVVILLCLLSLAFIAAIVVLLLAARKSEHEVDFTETVLFGVRWRWRYGQHGIYSLAAFCPDCDLQVHARPTVSRLGSMDAILYHCDDCDRQLQQFDCGYSEVEDRVTRKIQKALREKLRKGDDHAC